MGDVQAYIRPGCRIIEPPSLQEVKEVWEREKDNLHEPSFLLKLSFCLVPFAGRKYTIYYPGDDEKEIHRYCNVITMFRGKMYDWYSGPWDNYRTVPGMYKTGDPKYNG